MNSDQLDTLTLNTANGELTIETADLGLHVQTWTVKLYQQSDLSTSTGRQGVYQFDVILSNPCTLDAITPDTTISNQAYSIGRSGSVLLEPAYTQSDDLCPSTYGVSIITTGNNEVGLNSEQTATLTLNSANGHLTVETSDLALHG